jgi:uncharacterized protein YraI
MRACLVALAAPAALLFAPFAGAEEFPYSAFVARADAPVRSGPGEQFYPALTMARGDAVEVWRHDAGGWCAIRPPEGSFSWISADYVRAIDDRRGVVVGDQVNVRIGSRYSDVRDAIQVQASEGEELALIEARQPAGAAGGWWYKILPPNGEFRWIHQSLLVRHPDEIPAETPIAATVAHDGGARLVGFETPAAESAAAAAVSAAPAGPDSLEALDRALSQIVAGEPTAWHFSDLERRLEAILARAETPLERSQARMFAGKLARFEDIRRRYAQFAETRTQTAVIDREIVEHVEKVAPTVKDESLREVVNRAGPADIARYDGVGRLTPVVNQGSAGTGFALADENGAIVAMVVPAPGVNLRQYAGLEVGINGIKGYLPEKRLAQLTAKRIDVLTTRVSRSIAAATRRQ